jgi:prophage antirepressor-like protein
LLTNSIQVLSETELLGHKFTVYGTAENPLFLAKEVAECIDYAKRSNGSYNTTMMLQSVDEEEKVANIVDTLGGNQEVWFLTEDGLYEVLMQSRKPIAKEFKKGVKEILKSIRKTGGYIATTEEESPEEIMARALTIAQATKKYLFLFGDLYNCCTFAVRQFYYHIRIGDFLCPILKYCLKYKQRFLRTYSPQSRYGTVASWRNSLLSLFINF